MENQNAGMVVKKEHKSFSSFATFGHVTKYW